MPLPLMSRKVGLLQHLSRSILVYIDSIKSGRRTAATSERAAAYVEIVNLLHALQAAAWLLLLLNLSQTGSLLATERQPGPVQVTDEIYMLPAVTAAVDQKLSTSTQDSSAITEDASAATRLGESQRQQLKRALKAGRMLLADATSAAGGDKDNLVTAVDDSLTERLWMFIASVLECAASCNPSFLLSLLLDTVQAMRTS